MGNIENIYCLNPISGLPKLETTIRVYEHPVSHAPVFLRYNGETLTGWALMGASRFGTHPPDLNRIRAAIFNGRYQRYPVEAELSHTAVAAHNFGLKV